MVTPFGVAATGQAGLGGGFLGRDFSVRIVDFLGGWEYSICGRNFDFSATKHGGFSRSK
jgi:hypothetical protein